MAGGAFDPAEFASFKSQAPAAAPAAPAFDPTEFAAFKSMPTAPAVDTGASVDAKALDALSPFYQKGVSTRNSAGQFTPEARAVLSRQGINPDLIDHKAEKGLVDAYETKTMPAGDQSAAVGRGLINGIPVIGPSVLGKTNQAIAFVRAVQNGTKYDDELRHVESFGERTAKENPGSTIGGELAGGVLGTAPLVTYAPAAFGAGAGRLAVRAGAGLASGAVLGGADSAARNGGDLGETATGGAIGGALGAAGPLVGAGVGKAVNAFRNRGTQAPALLKNALDGISGSEISAAIKLRDDSLALPGGGAGLSFGEALNKVTDGRAGRVSQLERVTANSGGEAGRIAGELYSTRPDAVERVGRAAFGDIAPENVAPTRLGGDVQTAAQTGVAATPEGRALTAARRGAGPRVTADEAGQVIQPELRRVADAREAVRSLQADADYARARAAPENVGVESAVTVERPGEPVVTQERYSRPQFEPDAPAPLEGPNKGVASPERAGPESLARFIAKNGGIAADSDMLANDFHRFNVPGAGTVARDGGKPLDSFWRPKLMEAGYLPLDANGGTARDIRGELMRKLRNEQVGVPSYPAGSEREMAAVLAERNRTGQMADEFDNALDLAKSRYHEDLTSAGVDPASVHPDIQSRVLGATMRDPNLQPLDAHDAVVSRMRPNPEASVRTPTVTEEVPDVRFGQVNPQAALDAIDGQLRTAKGDVRGALAQARKDLFGPGGDTDLSVEGLLHARERLDTSIQAAREVGDRTKVRDLQIARSSLDGELKGVPEVARADANFATNSAPLEPFSGNTPLGRITQQDPLSGRMATPTEQVPTHLQGASAAREFLANATPEARTAYERHLSTRILDGATDRGGNISADALGKALRDNADLLGQTPDVARRLNGILRARDALAPIERTPLGAVASSPDVNNAVRALFAANPGANTHVEIEQAMRAIARANPQAARDVARHALEGFFNEATQSTKGIAAQYGGAGFASAVRGNPQQARNLEAAIRALPDGDVTWRGLDRMMTTMEAMGYRPQKGSDTAFNQAIQKQLAKGAPIGQAINDAVAGGAAGAVASGPKGAAAGAYFGLKRNVSAALDERQVLKNSEAIARIVFDPRSKLDLHALARVPAGSPRAAAITQRMLASVFAPIDASQERARAR